EDGDAWAPLALQLARALERGVHQRAGLKQSGDRSLFLYGFFSDSLRRRLVDVDCSWNGVWFRTPRSGPFACSNTSSGPASPA
ncbi:MAG TPA: hypothetical protein VH138_03065, partial [Vicinamibacterales bacterium]|nr:hypothetical protein [Vicinamibacterales bacterium]